MPRKSNPATDFQITVDDVGMFTFGRRTFADEFAIQRKFADLTGGGPTTEWLRLVGGWVSTLAVLTVKAPEGWDIDAMDPLDPDVYAQLNRVHDALLDREYSFRGRTREGSEAGSETQSGND